MRRLKFSLRGSDRNVQDKNLDQTRLKIYQRSMRKLRGIAIHCLLRWPYRLKQGKLCFIIYVLCAYCLHVSSFITVLTILSK